MVKVNFFFSENILESQVKNNKLFIIIMYYFAIVLFY